MRTQPIMPRKTASTLETPVVSLHARVTTALRDKIVEGSLRPGTPISERELCEELSVSRTPLREALKVLASENLVQLFPGRGAFVSPVSVDTIDSKFTVLAALEGLAAALVCKHASQVAIEELAALHESMSKLHARRDRAGYFAMNQRFHARIVELAANPVLSDLQTSLANHVRRARLEAVLQDVDLEQASADHESIIEALSSRDEVRARRILEQHVLDVGRSVIGHFRGHTRRVA